MLKIPKIWRELPIDKKLEIPNTKFNISKGEIFRIRKIKNKRKKFIESVKLQFKLFGEIHSYLTAWIAGYSSDSEVRVIFGSTAKMREIFMKSPKKIKFVNFSWSDIKRDVKIPEKMSIELAEETGIHLGDGSLSVYSDKNKWKTYQYSISGDLKNESLYHESFIAPLVKKLYNLNLSFSKRLIKNSIESKLRSRAIVQFKNRILGLPVGNKKMARIPKQILRNNEFSKKCLIGIFDTDFNITSSLSISGKLHSLILAEQIHKILNQNNILHVFRKYTNYTRFYIPKKYALIIAKEWHLHNLKHLSKFDVFNKFGIFIPFSTTQERLDLLNGDISLKELIKISKLRQISFRSQRLCEDSNLGPHD